MSVFQTFLLGGLALNGGAILALWLMHRGYINSRPIFRVLLVGAIVLALGSGLLLIIGVPLI